MKKVLSFIVHILLIFCLLGCEERPKTTMFEEYTKWVSEDENLILYSYLYAHPGYGRININGEYVLMNWGFGIRNQMYYSFYNPNPDSDLLYIGVAFKNFKKDAYRTDKTKFFIEHLVPHNIELDDKWENWSSTMTKYPLNEDELDAKYFLMDTMYCFANETYGLKFEYYERTYPYQGEIHKHYDNSYYTFRFFGEYYNKDLVLAFLDNSTFKIEYFYNGRGIGSTGKYYSKQGCVDLYFESDILFGLEGQTITLDVKPAN